MNFKLLSEVALAFVGHEGFDVQLNRALKTLCNGLQLSRAYVFLDGKERATMGTINEWCAEGIATQWMQDIPYTSYAMWKRILAADGRILSYDISTLPEDLLAVVTPHGIKATLVYPIEIGHEIAGFIGFDDCWRQRLWENAEVELLLKASQVVSAFCELASTRQQLQTGAHVISPGGAEESILDPLTGLHNRRYVFERLRGFDAEYARRGRNFCVSIIDLDNFRSINYTYGRDAGDFVLKEFAKLLNDAIRPYDVCGRYGGEEFIVVSVNASATETVFMIERIMTELRKRLFVFKGMEIRVRFSCGISSGSEFTPENLSIDKLVEMANRRMYAAKQSGRDRFVTPSPEA